MEAHNQPFVAGVVPTAHEPAMAQQFPRRTYLLPGQFCLLLLEITAGHRARSQQQPYQSMGHWAEMILAAFMSQDKSFLVFRRFSKLNLQVLLKMQAGIFQLEQKLVQAKAAGDSDAVSTSELIAKQLHQYNAALLQYSQLTGLHRAEDTSISDLRQYIVNVAKGDTPIRRLLTAGDADEADFVSLDRDRIPRNRMYRLVERLTWRLFTTTAAGGRRVELPQQGTLYIFDDSMIQTTFRAIITMLTFLILLTPIIVLSFMEEKRKMLIVIVVCTAAAAAIMATTTDCREHEIMIAASTYAAALLVYISD
ncbi:hypothetical protein IFM5058_05062 [Aspergillus udagawae]|nr:hypothetical protein IFM5058_05062 [Aspergillus udagawae]